MKYFTIKELVSSNTAKINRIDNTPTKEIESHLVELVDNLLDPLREAWTTYCNSRGWKNAAIIVNSGYRCPLLNTKVGGVKNSAHLIGYAADLSPANKKIKEFIEFCSTWIKTKKFDQCIDEYGKWCHLSYKSNNGSFRKQIFKIR